jgi:hypothetical protein
MNENFNNKKVIGRKGLKGQAPIIKPKFLIATKIIPIYQTHMQNPKFCERGGRTPR